MFNSIRSKLTLWYAGVLAFLLIGFAAIAYFSVDLVLTQSTDEYLLETSKNFIYAVNFEKDEKDNEQDEDEDKPSEKEAIIDVVDDFRLQGFKISMLSSNENLIAKTFDAGLPMNFSDNSYTTFQFENQTFRTFKTPFKVGDINYKLLVYQDLAEYIKIKARLLDLFFTAIPIALLTSILLGYFLARRGLKPVEEIGRQAKAISANNLQERLFVKNKRDEIGRLASVFNDLLERLENSFEQQRRFMADASHELRTPLAIVRGESEVALSKEDRSNAELRESLTIVNDESKRLTKIVEDLFTLSRADAGQYKTNFKQVYVDELLSDCMRHIRVLAETKNISCEFSAQETSISGDEELLRRLFLNLLDNAVKYNRKGGKVTVTLADNIVSISDTGFGIAKDEQANIFDRFYRTDKSRNRSEESNTSGAGLGLSIAKWIAELHKANLTLSKSDESGSTFSIIFSR